MDIPFDVIATGAILVASKNKIRVKIASDLLKKRFSTWTFLG